MGAHGTNKQQAMYSMCSTHKDIWWPAWAHQQDRDTVSFLVVPSGTCSEQLESSVKYNHPQVFSAADSLHSRAVDGQWGVVTRVSPEVHLNLFCLTQIERQVVCTTPFSQLCHFLSVVRFIVVADETYH